MIKQPPSRTFFLPLTWAFLGMIVVALTGMFVLFSAKELEKPQELRQQASTGDESGVRFRLRPDKTTISKNQSVVVDVMMNTGNQRISAVDVAGQVKGTNASVTMSRTAETGLKTAYSHQKAVSGVIDWQSIVFAVTTNNQLYSSSNREIVLASLVVQPTNTGTITVSADAEVTGISPPSSIVSILSPVTVSVTEVQASSPPDQGIHRNCNEYCADSRECASQYTCYYNRCRNPRNINNEQCQEPPSPTPVSSPTPQPRGGTTTTRTTPKGKTVPTAKIVDIKTKPTVTPPPISNLTVDGKGSTKSASTPRPTPSPSPSPTPTPSPSEQPSPSPEEVKPEKTKGKTNIFLVTLLVTLLIGGVAGLGYVVIKYRG